MKTGGCGSSTHCRTSVRSSILQILTLWRECSQASAQSWSEGSAQAKRRYQWKWCWLRVSSPRYAGIRTWRICFPRGVSTAFACWPATADTGVERDRLVDLFDSHLVFGLQDEEASTRLLGTPWALTLAEPGRMLVRLGRRKEVEVLGLHLTEDGRRDLLASMGVVETAPEVAEVDDPRPEQRSVDTPRGMTADGTRNTLGATGPYGNRWRASTIGVRRPISLSGRVPRGAGIGACRRWPTCAAPRHCGTTCLRRN